MVLKDVDYYVAGSRISIWLCLRRTLVLKNASQQSEIAGKSVRSSYDAVSLRLLACWLPDRTYKWVTQEAMP